MTIPIILLLSAVTFVVGAGTARLLGATSDNTNRFGSIDGLRGYLALGVFTHHFFSTYYWHTTGTWNAPPEKFLAHLGQASVSLFFMITGFLFIRKILVGNVNWRALYIGRVFRIVPLYLAVVMAVIITIAFISNGQINESIPALVLHILEWVFFIRSDINAYADTELIIAGVDWTLRYEWFFYASLPLISVILWHPKKWPAITLITIITIAGMLRLHGHGINMIHLFNFMVGGIAARIDLWAGPDLRRMAHHHKTTVIMLVALTLVLFFFDRAHSFWPSILLGVFFIPITLGNSIFGLLHLRASRMLGDISYSIYLLHGIILYYIFTLIWPTYTTTHNMIAYALLMPMVGAIIVAAATLTYRLIERPMIALGQKIINRPTRRLSV